MFIFSFILSLFANHLPVMYVQVPQWADDWAVCAVDIPDAKCHWYVVAPDNTFGEGFDWETAPWFDANGLNDVAPMQEVSVLEKLQRKKMKTFSQFKEDIDSMKATMKGFADTMVPQMKKFAKSKEAKDLKTNVMNMFIDKGNQLLDKGKKKLGEFEKKVK